MEPGLTLDQALRERLFMGFLFMGIFPILFFIGSLCNRWA